ncbi:VWA domain-containing protein [Streptococcus phocae subsp. salmonis]|uniref:DUF7604 domain-containing protein n=1 Tax=Streptococcus phocae TaxID=119224 RepID=UPI00068F922E|nr:SpaA isopeptide-forming pilin-related protein [Streptococcus phocae]
MKHKIHHKLISLVATAGLIFSQLALPVAQIASTTGHAETHQSQSGERASPAGSDPVSKETKKTQSSPTAVSTTQSGDIIVTLDGEKSADALASLASLKTAEDTKRNDQDLDKLSQELKKQSLKITDAQIIDLTNLPVSENLGVTLSFKEGLALAGLTEKEEKNLKIGILTSESDEVSVVDAEKVALAKEEGQAQKVKELSYKGKTTQPNTRIIITRTTKLQEKTELDLKNYGKLVLDGTTEQEKTDQLSPYRKPVTIKVLQPKKGTIESTFESTDFEEVETIKNLFVWQKDFTIIDYLSDDYKVVKTEYQKANAETFETKEMLYGDYEAVNHARDGKYSENVVKVYLRSSQPLELAPMLPAKVATPGPRSFKSALSGGEEGKKAKRSRFKRSLLPPLEPRSARSRRSIEPMKKSGYKGDLAYHKQIDYLGDGVENPDTTIDKNNPDLEDLYRLYLDITGKALPLDVLIVVDRSASMKEPLGSDFWYLYQRYSYYGGRWYTYGTTLLKENKGSHYTEGGYYYSFIRRVNKDTSAPRDQAVKNALLGDKGLIKKILDINSENQVAVIGFQGKTDYAKEDGIFNNFGGKIYQPYLSKQKDADVIAEWGKTNFLDDSKLSYMKDNGTNYDAGLLLANTMLKQVAGRSSKKIMIFISDGVPTFYLGPQHREGTGRAIPENVIAVQPHAQDAIDQFKSQNKDLVIYSLGVSEDINGETESSSPVVLKYLSENERYRSITDTETLEKTFNTIVDESKVSKVSITDELSKNIVYYGNQPDLKVTRKSNAGEIEDLFVKQELTLKGKEVLESVDFIKDSNSDKPGTVKLVFQPSFKMDDKYVYSLSFNVKASDEAYRQYANSKGKYTDTGDSDTDFKSNQTSSKKEGFNSNETATVNYYADGQNQSKPYPHPVIQVRTVPMTIEKVDAKNSNTKLDNVEFELYREDDKDKKKVWEEGTTKGGQLTFKYLQKGKTYDLYETQAKPGYALPQEPWKVKVDKKGNVTVADQNGKNVDVKGPNKEPVDEKKGKTFVLTNHKINLPTTGGSGTYTYVIFGMTVATVSLGAYSYRKKKA